MRIATTLFLAASAIAFSQSSDVLESRAREAYEDAAEHLLPFDDHGWFKDSNRKALGKILRQKRIRTVVELGSWLGKSSRFIARHLVRGGKLYCVDTFEGGSDHKAGIEIDRLPTLYSQFLSNIIHAGLQDRVVPLKMTTLEAAAALENRVAPDLVYVDAEHTTEAVYADLCAWYPLVKSRGVLCGDDWLWESVRAAVEPFARENGLDVFYIGNFWVLSDKPADRYFYRTFLKRKTAL